MTPSGRLLSQIHSDVRCFGGYRVQERVLDASVWPDPKEDHRVLDPKGRVLRHGSLAECDELFRSLVEPADPGRGVVLALHGLGRTRESMRAPVKRLRSEGYTVVNVGYASTRASIRSHVARVAQLITHLPLIRSEGSEAPTPISFVTHSLGGIIVRILLAEHPEAFEALKPHRLFMFAPPSRGATFAHRLPDSIFGPIFGPPKQELAAGPDGRPDIPPPSIPFGIAVGSLRNGRGINPLIDGDDDGIVAVEEARLPGAELFCRVPSIHTFVMQHPHALDACVGFLEGRTDD